MNNDEIRTEFVRLLNFPSIARVQYDPLFVSYTVGIAVLWLFTHKLGNHNRFVTFLLAMLVMVVVGFVGLASYSMDIFSDETTMFLAFLTILALSVLVGYVLDAESNIAVCVLCCGLPFG